MQHLARCRVCAMSETDSSKRSSGMKSVLLVATSLAVLVSPAASTSAQEFTGGQQFRDGPGAPSERFTMRPTFRGGFGSAFDCDGRDGRHRHGRRNIALSECAAFPVGLGYFDED